MSGLESYSPFAKNKCDYYKQKIAEHTPPITESDKLIVRTYQRFLIRDRSLQYNLELLKMMKTMRKRITPDEFGMSTCFTNQGDALDLEALRTLLDESSG